jgi:hypothetical protein
MHEKKILVNHEGREINFIDFSYKGNYEEVIEMIKEENLNFPNSQVMSSLIFEIFNYRKPKLYEIDILEPLINNNKLWEYTGNLFLPKTNTEISNGVILDNSPRFIEGKLVMDKTSLINRIKEGDSMVKFVPFEYKSGRQYAKELEKNPYIQARYGEEGAEKIARATSLFGSLPILEIPNFVDTEIMAISKISNHYGFGNNRYTSIGIENRLSEEIGMGIEGLENFEKRVFDVWGYSFGYE